MVPSLEECFSFSPLCEAFTAVVWPVINFCRAPPMTGALICIVRSFRPSNNYCMSTSYSHLSESLSSIIRLGRRHKQVTQIERKKERRRRKKERKKEKDKKERKKERKKKERKEEKKERKKKKERRKKEV